MLAIPLQGCRMTLQADAATPYRFFGEYIMICRMLVLSLAALIAIAAPLRAADSSATKRDDSASEKLGLKLSLQCWTFNKLSFFETVDRAAGLGIKYLEIYPGQKLK